MRPGAGAEQGRGCGEGWWPPRLPDATERSGKVVLGTQHEQPLRRDVGLPLGHVLGVHALDELVAVVVHPRLLGQA